MQMRSSIKNNKLFSRHSNLEQYLKPQMPLSLGEERLSFADRKWTLLGRQKKSWRCPNIGMEGIEIVLREFALGEFDGRSREHINYWQTACLEAKIKTIKRWNRHWKIQLKDLQRLLTQFLNIFVKHAIVQCMLDCLFPKTVTGIQLVWNSNQLESLTKNFNYWVMPKYNFAGQAK